MGDVRSQVRSGIAVSIPYSIISVGTHDYYFPENKASKGMGGLCTTGRRDRFVASPSISERSGKSTKTESLTLKTRIVSRL